ncbi:DMT family transporter [Rhodobacter sp. Har01]|uniref:DMT family transporter n=1 Tax=Rhodobacter sp. Har01 TaxID=2883999 RepID=UPI001D09572E|nr:DMT family transporter [Rhodobacter sp. Har01]MCB6179724.1 DMT family transporter [Rhodobacter sp. Har01]
MPPPSPPTQDSGPRDRAALVGVVLMMLVGVINAVDAVIVRLLAKEVHPFIIGLTRTSFGLLAMLPWILSRPQMLRTSYRLMHVLRAALKLASLIAVFFALAEAKLADVTSIGFAAPLFVTVGAWLLFGERPQAVRILAVMLGFVGVLVVLNPDWTAGQRVSPALMLALLGALLTAVIQLMLKAMAGNDRTDTLVAWNLIVSVPLAVIPAWLVWQTPSAFHWGLLAVQGALGALNQTMVTRAFQLADASLVAPIDFLRLPFVAILAFVLFQEVAGLSTWVGAALIFVATMIMAATRRSRPPAAPEA